MKFSLQWVSSGVFPLSGNHNVCFCSWTAECRKPKLKSRTGREKKKCLSVPIVTKRSHLQLDFNNIVNTILVITRISVLYVEKGLLYRIILMNTSDLTREEVILAIIVVKFSSVRKTCGITHRYTRVSTGSPVMCAVEDLMWNKISLSTKRLIVSLPWTVVERYPRSSEFWYWIQNFVNVYLLTSVLCGIF